MGEDLADHIDQLSQGIRLASSCVGSPDGQRVLDLVRTRVPAVLRTWLPPERRAPAALGPLCRFIQQVFLQFDSHVFPASHRTELISLALRVLLAVGPDADEAARGHVRDTMACTARLLFRMSPSALAVFAADLAHAHSTCAAWSTLWPGPRGATATVALMHGTLRAVHVDGSGSGAGGGLKAHCDTMRLRFKSSQHISRLQSVLSAALAATIAAKPAVVAGASHFRRPLCSLLRGLALRFDAVAGLAQPGAAALDLGLLPDARLAAQLLRSSEMRAACAPAHSFCALICSVCAYLAALWQLLPDASGVELETALVEFLCAAADTGPDAVGGGAAAGRAAQPHHRVLAAALEPAQLWHILSQLPRAPGDAGIARVDLMSRLMAALAPIVAFRAALVSGDSLRACGVPPTTPLQPLGGAAPTQTAADPGPGAVASLLGQVAADAPAVVAHWGALAVALAPPNPLPTASEGDANRAAAAQLPRGAPERGHGAGLDVGPLATTAAQLRRLAAAAVPSLAPKAAARRRRARTAQGGTGDGARVDAALELPSTGTEGIESRSPTGSWAGGSPPAASSAGRGGQWEGDPVSALASLLPPSAAAASAPIALPDRAAPHVHRILALAHGSSPEEAACVALGALLLLRAHCATLGPAARAHAAATLLRALCVAATRGCPADPSWRAATATCLAACGRECAPAARAARALHLGTAPAPTAAAAATGQPQPSDNALGPVQAQRMAVQVGTWVSEALVQVASVSSAGGSSWLRRWLRAASDLLVACGPGAALLHRQAHGGSGDGPSRGRDVAAAVREALPAAQATCVDMLAAPRGQGRHGTDPAFARHLGGHRAALQALYLLRRPPPEGKGSTEERAVHLAAYYPPLRDGWGAMGFAGSNGPPPSRPPGAGPRADRPHSRQRSPAEHAAPGAYARTTAADGQQHATSGRPASWPQGEASAAAAAGGGQRGMEEEEEDEEEEGDEDEEREEDAAEDDEGGEDEEGDGADAGDGASALGIFFANTSERMRTRKRRRRISQFASPSMRSPKLRVFAGTSPPPSGLAVSPADTPGGRDHAHAYPASGTLASALRHMTAHAASLATALAEDQTDETDATALAMAVEALDVACQGAAVAWRHLLGLLHRDSGSSAEAAVLLDACVAPAAALKAVLVATASALRPECDAASGAQPRGPSPTTASAASAQGVPPYRLLRATLVAAVRAATRCPLPELVAAAIVGRQAATASGRGDQTAESAAGQGQTPPISLPVTGVPFAMAWAAVAECRPASAAHEKTLRRAVRLRMQQAAAALGGATAMDARATISAAGTRFALGVLHCAPAVASVAGEAPHAPDLLGACIALAARHEDCGAGARRAVDACVQALKAEWVPHVGPLAGISAHPFVVAARALAWVQCTPYPSSEVADTVLAPALLAYDVVYGDVQRRRWRWQGPRGAPQPKWLRGAVHAAGASALAAAARRIGRSPRRAVDSVAQGAAGSVGEVVRRLGLPDHEATASQARGGDAAATTPAPTTPTLLASARRHAQATRRAAQDEASRAANGLAILGAVLHGACSAVAGLARGSAHRGDAAADAAPDGAVVHTLAGEFGAPLVFAAAVRAVSALAAHASSGLSVRGSRGARTRAAAAALLAPCKRVKSHRNPQALPSLDNCVPSLSLGTATVPPLIVDAVSAHAAALLLRAWSSHIRAVALPPAGAERDSDGPDDADGGAAQASDEDGSHEEDLWAARAFAWSARLCCEDYGTTLVRGAHVWRVVVFAGLRDPLTGVASSLVAHNLAREAMHLPRRPSELLMWTAQELLPELLRRERHSAIAVLVASLSHLLNAEDSGRPDVSASVSGAHPPPHACQEAVQSSADVRNGVQRSLRALAPPLLVHLMVFRVHGSPTRAREHVETALCTLLRLTGESLVQTVATSVQPLLRILTWELAGAHASAALSSLARIAAVARRAEEGAAAANAIAAQVEEDESPRVKRRRATRHTPPATRNNARCSKPSGGAPDSEPRVVRELSATRGATRSRKRAEPSTGTDVGGRESDVASVHTLTSIRGGGDSPWPSSRRRFRLSRGQSAGDDSGGGGEGGDSGGGGGGDTGPTLALASMQDSTRETALEGTLAKHFLFLMNVLGRALRPQIGVLVQRRALGALEVLLRSLRPEALHPFVPAVTSVLKHAVQHPSLRLAACRAWHTFVLRVGDPDLRSILSTVVVALAGVVVELFAEREERGRASSPERSGAAASGRGDAVCVPTVYEVSSDVEEDEEVGEATDEADEMASIAASSMLMDELGAGQPSEGAAGADSAVRALASAVMAAPVVAGTSAGDSARTYAHATLAYLLRDRREHLRESIARMPMLPDHPSLGAVTTVLREEIEPRSLEGRLDNLRLLLCHDALGVQRAALRALRNLLRARACSVLDTALQGGAAAPVVQALVRALLGFACRASDSAARLLCAECLGELSAVDPARLSIDGVRAAEPLRTGNAFAVELLQRHLVRELRASPESALQDRVALAMQETLRFLTTRRNSKRSLSRDELRLALDASVFPTVEPYLCTSYELTGDAPRREDTRPLYPRCATFEQWIAAWCKRLIDDSKGPLQPLFRACRAMITHSPPTATFLLPALVVDVIVHGSPRSTNLVADEIKAVLRDERRPRQTSDSGAAPPQPASAHHTRAQAAAAATTADGAGAAASPSPPITASSHAPPPPPLFSGAPRPGTTTAATANPASSGGVRVRAAQAVFALLDRLQAFSISGERQSRRSHGGGRSERGAGSSNMRARTRNRPSKSSGRSQQQQEQQQQHASEETGPERPELETEAAVEAEAMHVEQALQALGDRIPKRELASAAFRCRAHTRALQWLEAHLREELGKNSSFATEPTLPREALAFMQQIYAALDEPDGLEGIGRLRSRLGQEERNVTLRERIVDHEHAAKWSDALLCYEQAIQMADDAGQGVDSVAAAGPSGPEGGAPAPARAAAERELVLPEAEEGSEPLMVQLHSGLLRCMLRAGHLDMLLRQVEAIVRRCPPMAPHVVPYAVNACWQLGRWHEVDALLREGSRLGLHAPAGPSDAAGHRGLLLLSGSAPVRTSSTLTRALRTVADAVGRADAGPAAAWPAAPGGGDAVPFSSATTATLASLPAGAAPGGHIALPTAPSTPTAPAARPQQAYALALGASMAAMARGDRPAFRRGVEAARLAVMEPLSAAAMDSHRRAYPWLVKLHVLRELEQGFEAREAAGDGSGATGPSSSPTGDDTPRTQAASSRLRSYLRQCGWSQRRQLLMPTESAVEPVLAVRRALYRQCGMREEEAATWLRSASMARQARHPQSASSALLHARRVGSAGADVEQARLLWEEGNAHEALQLLEPVEPDLVRLAHEGERLRGEDRAALAERLFVATEWLRALGQRPARDIVERYAAIVRLRRDWEKGYFSLGAYYDSLLERLADEEVGDAGREAQGEARRSGRRRSGSSRARSGSDNRRAGRDGATADAQTPHASLAGLRDLYGIKADMTLGTVAADTRRRYLVHVLRNYGRALEHGCEHLHESLPRLLTLWFNHCEVLHHASELEDAAGEDIGPVAARNARQLTADLCTEVGHVVNRLPAYKWLTALSQLVSRVAHHCPDVWRVLSQALKKILHAHPMHALWTALGLVHYDGKQRRSRMEHVIAEVANEREALQHVFHGANTLYRFLIRLARFRCEQPKVNTRADERLSWLGDLKLVMPLQSQLTVALPGTGGGSTGTHQPFPEPQVTIQALDNDAVVMSSKEKPKKVTLIGSDGCKVNFLCKAEQRGDLRKDARMMEFSTLVNRLLAQDAEGRRRKLSLRTYAVICLSEDCGMLEWVPNTSALRSLIAAQYTRQGHRRPASILASMQQTYTKAQSDYARRPPALAQEYQRKIAPHFPALFHRWFSHTFPEPTAWYAARVAFTRTAAVWAMVGHVVGLGDRHGENILLDCTTGECVHVDYDCIFDKGLSLACPEVVPFRLTHNMVDAMGPMAYHGVFTCVSRVVLSLLRRHRTMIMSTLESFLHDPLVEWSRHVERGGGCSSDSHAVRSIRRIEDRLHGKYNQGPGAVPPTHARYDIYMAQRSNAARRGLTRNSSDATEDNLVVEVRGRADALPLSVNGQVKTLLEEATKLENLAQMYIGWMPML